MVNTLIQIDRPTQYLKVFDFKNKSGTIINYQRWIIDKGTLIVTGDNYASVYRWNNSGVSLKFLAECNLDYFNEKCLADKDGSNQTLFDSSDTELYLKQIAVEHLSMSAYESGSKLISADPEKFDELSLDKKFDLLKPYINSIRDDIYDLDSFFSYENVYEAAAALHDPENECFFGSDGWEYGSGLESYTIVPKLHLAALRSAYSRYPDAF